MYLTFQCSLSMDRICPSPSPPPQSPLHSVLQASCEYLPHEVRHPAYMLGWPEKCWLSLGTLPQINMPPAKKKKEQTNTPGTWLVGKGVRGPRAMRTPESTTQVFTSPKERGLFIYSPGLSIRILCSVPEVSKSRFPAEFNLLVQFEKHMRDRAHGENPAEVSTSKRSFVVPLC